MNTLHNETPRPGPSSGQKEQQHLAMDEHLEAMAVEARTC